MVSPLANSTRLRMKMTTWTFGDIQYTNYIIPFLQMTKLRLVALMHLWQQKVCYFLFANSLLLFLISRLIPSKLVWQEPSELMITNHSQCLQGRQSLRQLFFVLALWKESMQVLTKMHMNRKLSLLEISIYTCFSYFVFDYSCSNDVVSKAFRDRDSLMILYNKENPQSRKRQHVYFIKGKLSLPQEYFRHLKSKSILSILVNTGLKSFCAHWLW